MRENHDDRLKIADCKLRIADCRRNGERQICNLQSSIFSFASSLLPFRRGLAVAGLGPGIKPPKIVGVRVGIADRYKAGLWTQVEVTLLGGSETLTGEVSVIVPDGDGVPGRVRRPRKPCQVLPGRRRSFGSSPASVASTAT